MTTNELEFYAHCSDLERVDDGQIPFRIMRMLEEYGGSLSYTGLLKLCQCSEVELHHGLIVVTQCDCGNVQLGESSRGEAIYSLPKEYKYQWTNVKGDVIHTVNSGYRHAKIITLHLSIEEVAAILDVPIPAGQGKEHRRMAMLKLKAAIMAAPGDAAEKGE